MLLEYEYRKIDGKNIEYQTFKRTSHTSDEAGDIYNEFRRCDVIAFSRTDDAITAYRFTNADVTEQDRKDMEELTLTDEVVSYDCISMFGGDELYDMIADDIAEMMKEYSVTKDQVVAALEQRFGVCFDTDDSSAWTSDEVSILYAYAASFIKVMGKKEESNVDPNIQYSQMLNILKSLNENWRQHCLAQGRHNQSCLSVMRQQTEVLESIYRAMTLLHARILILEGRG